MAGVAGVDDRGRRLGPTQRARAASRGAEVLLHVFEMLRSDGPSRPFSLLSCSFFSLPVLPCGLALFAFPHCLSSIPPHVAIFLCCALGS